MDTDLLIGVMASREQHLQTTWREPFLAIDTDEELIDVGAPESQFQRSDHSERFRGQCKFF